MQQLLKNYSIQKRIFFLLIFVTNFIGAQNKDLFSKELFIKGKDTLKFRLLLPKNFSEDKMYPLVLFLHGRGEQGNDNVFEEGLFFVILYKPKQ